VRYDLACDYLEEDLASGYVRVLQEMLAAGWAEPALAEQVSGLLAEGESASPRESTTKA
jgi:hypothetical protein